MAIVVLFHLQFCISIRMVFFPRDMWYIHSYLIGNGKHSVISGYIKILNLAVVSMCTVTHMPSLSPSNANQEHSEAKGI